MAFRVMCDGPDCDEHVDGIMDYPDGWWILERTVTDELLARLKEDSYAESGWQFCSASCLSSWAKVKAGLKAV